MQEGKSAFQTLRHAMVEQQLRARGIHSSLVLQAMDRVQRESFLPESLREQAYEDSPLPIAEGQTISQPYIVGYMIDALDLEERDLVLEVGTGSGYAAAVLAEIAGRVITVERHKSLADRARRTLEIQGYDNVEVFHGDGSQGWPPDAPFDAILVSAGAPVVPRALREQLAVGGRMLIPVGGTQSRQKLLRITRESENSYDEEELLDVRFVPLIGEPDVADQKRPRANLSGTTESERSVEAKSWQSETAHETRARSNIPIGEPRLGEPRALSELMATEADAIDDLDQVDLAPLMERIGDARVVCIGEASHGTAEFYRFRARITQELIEKKDFDFVAVEADWPDASRIDYFVRHMEAPPSTWTAFSRFPTWMWRNEEVRRFVDWLHEHNGNYDRLESRMAFYGLDLYSLYNSIDSVLAYLEKVDPKTAHVARQRYACFNTWRKDPIDYGRAAAAGNDRCEHEVLDMLAELLQKRLEYAAKDGDQFLDALQNARLVANAERYYRNMYQGYSDSWNLRDNHMFETLESIFEHRNRQFGGFDRAESKQRKSKGVVWAHNSHLGDASKTDMALRGQLNIGQLCRERFGEDAYLIGFGTHTGTVTAASNWGASTEFKAVRPSLTGSWESVAHDSKLPAFMLGMRECAKGLREQLRENRLQRAIGVIYLPESERASHYFRARLGEQFDEYMWFDETQAVKPIETHRLAGMPETYPFGL